MPLREKSRKKDEWEVKSVTELGGSFYLVLTDIENLKLQLPVAVWNCTAFKLCHCFLFNSITLIWVLWHVNKTRFSSLLKAVFFSSCFCLIWLPLHVIFCSSLILSVSLSLWWRCPAVMRQGQRSEIHLNTDASLWRLILCSLCSALPCTPHPNWRLERFPHCVSQSDLRSCVFSNRLVETIIQEREQPVPCFEGVRL